MRRLLEAGLLLTVCFAFIPAHALVLYDTFSAGHIDPDKWALTPLCDAPGASICVREVKLGALHLRVRVQTSSGVPQAQVLFTDPDPIHTIRFSFVVASFRSQGGCPDDSAHPQLAVSGTFFSASQGDVFAFLIVERRSDDALPPGVLRVSGFTADALGFSNNVDLGTLRVGEPAAATLRWDATRNSFVWRVVKAITHPHVAEQVMAYPEPPTGPAVEQFKALSVLGFAPDCGSPSVASMDAWIDNGERLSASVTHEPGRRAHSKQRD
jgi:hypothetical protein